MATAEEREASLLLAALHDELTARAYAASHGLCLRHVLALGGEAGAALPRQVLRGRLKVLEWELQEAGRKGNWSVRYERMGDERTAWRRVPGYLDGRVFLGGPSPATRVAG